MLEHRKTILTKNNMKNNIKNNNDVKNTFDYTLRKLMLIFMFNKLPLYWP